MRFIGVLLFSISVGITRVFGSVFNDFYGCLKIDTSATRQEIKKAYYDLAKKSHPDKHSKADKADSEEAFRKIADAYETLMDPEKRKDYDDQRNAILERAITIHLIDRHLRELRNAEANLNVENETLYVYSNHTIQSYTNVVSSSRNYYLFLDHLCSLKVVESGKERYRNYAFTTPTSKTAAACYAELSVDGRLQVFRKKGGSVPKRLLWKSPNIPSSQYLDQHFLELRDSGELVILRMEMFRVPTQLLCVWSSFTDGCSDRVTHIFTGLPEIAKGDGKYERQLKFNMFFFWIPVCFGLPFIASLKALLSVKLMLAALLIGVSLSAGHSD